MFHKFREKIYPHNVPLMGIKSAEQEKGVTKKRPRSINKMPAKQRSANTHTHTHVCRATLSLHLHLLLIFACPVGSQCVSHPQNPQKNLLKSTENPLKLTQNAARKLKIMSTEAAASASANVDVGVDAEVLGQRRLISFLPPILVSFVARPLKCVNLQRLACSILHVRGKSVPGT